MDASIQWGAIMARKQREKLEVSVRHWGVDLGWRATVRKGIACIRCPHKHLSEASAIECGEVMRQRYRSARLA